MCTPKTLTIVINEGEKEQDYYVETPEATFPGVRKICPRFGNGAKVYDVPTVGRKVSRWLRGIVWLLRVCTLA